MVIAVFMPWPYLLPAPECPLPIFSLLPFPSIRFLPAVKWMLVFPPNSHVEALTSKCDEHLFGGGTLGRWLGLDEVMRMEPHGGIRALIKRRPEFLSISVMWEHSKEAAVYKPGRGPSPGGSTGTFFLDFSDSRAVRNKCLLFKPPSLQYSLVAAQANKSLPLLSNPPKSSPILGLPLGTIQKMPELEASSSASERPTFGSPRRLVLFASVSPSSQVPGPCI